ncbi:hypothetical protein C6558_38340, partial [Ensifer sp. NM-2]
MAQSVEDEIRFINDKLAALSATRKRSALYAYRAPLEALRIRLRQIKGAPSLMTVVTAQGPARGDTIIQQVRTYLESKGETAAAIHLEAAVDALRGLAVSQQLQEDRHVMDNLLDKYRHLTPKTKQTYRHALLDFLDFRSIQDQVEPLTQTLAAGGDARNIPLVKECITYFGQKQQEAIARNLPPAFELVRKYHPDYKVPWNSSRCYIKLVVTANHEIADRTKDTHIVALNALEEHLPQIDVAAKFMEVVTGSTYPEKTLQDCEDYFARKKMKIARKHLTPALERVRRVNNPQVKAAYSFIGSQLDRYNTCLVGEREEIEIVLTEVAMWLLQNRDARSLKDVITGIGQEGTISRAEDDMVLKACEQHLQRPNKKKALACLFPVINFIRGHSRSLAPPNDMAVDEATPAIDGLPEPGPSEVNNDPGSTEEMIRRLITYLLRLTTDEEKLICETVLTALATWLGQNPDLPTFGRFIAVTVQGQDPLSQDGLEEEDPLLYGGPAENDWILIMCREHLFATSQTLAYDHIFGVFDYLRGHSDRTSEIKATFDLGGGTYYRAWIDAVLPKLGAFVQANISSETGVVVYDQQGTCIAAPPTENSTPLVLRCDEHRHFDMLQPPSEFNASERIILPSDHTAISADGYQYETENDQGRISLFICLAEYNARGVFTRHSGRGLLDPEAGPDEILARFDSWMTIFHPDLRSQLNAAADLAWLKTVTTMLW